MTGEQGNGPVRDAIEYRNNNFEPLRVMTSLSHGPYQERVYCNIEIEEILSGHSFSHSLKVYNRPITGGNLIEIGHPETSIAFIDFAKDIILLGDWRTTLQLDMNSISEIQTHKFYIHGNALQYNRDINSIAEENRIARWLILEKLYKTDLTKVEISPSKFHFPVDAMIKAIEALNDLHFIEITYREPHTFQGKYEVRMTAHGMKYFEEKELPAHNQVFIIAPCAEQGIISVFKKVRSEKGYPEDNLIVQEVREPKEETIRDAILSNIRSCKFIMADITGGQIRSGKRFNPNCVYELGWAHALGKKVICTVRRDMAFSKHEHNKISYLPFDISIIPFSFWDANNEVEIIDELKRKIDDVHKYFQREYWSNA